MKQDQHRPQGQGAGLGVQENPLDQHRPQGAGLGVQENPLDQHRPQGAGLGVQENPLDLDQHRPQGAGLGVQENPLGPFRGNEGSPSGQKFAVRTRAQGPLPRESRSGRYKKTPGPVSGQ